MWPSIRLLLAIGVGKERFEEFLLGGKDVETHFAEVPLDRNIPVLMTLLGLWYCNIWGLGPMPSFPATSEWRGFPLICSSSK